MSLRSRAGPAIRNRAPALPAAIELTRDEIEAIAEALLMSAEQLRSVRLFGYDLGLLDAIETLIAGYVAARLQAGAALSAREIETEQRKIDAGLINIEQWIAAEIAELQAPSVKGHAWRDLASIAEANAGFMDFLNGARRLRSAVAVRRHALRAAAAKRGRRTGRDDTHLLFVGLVVALEEAGLVTNPGGLHEADAADEIRPIVRLARVVLRIALDRIRDEAPGDVVNIAASEPAGTLSLLPRSLVGLILAARKGAPKAGFERHLFVFRRLKPPRTIVSIVNRPSSPDVIFVGSSRRPRRKG